MLLLFFGLLAVPVYAQETEAVGDLFVVSKRGAAIFVDGKATGQQAPAMLKGLAAGSHEIRVDLDCQTASATRTLREGAVERVELELQPGVGELWVVTDPVGAKVFLGEHEVGVSPVGPVQLPCGSADLHVELDGYLPVDQVADVTLHTPTTVKMVLQPSLLGSLAIAVEPVDATVEVDGHAVGAGPMTLDEVAAGDHLVGAKLRRYQPVQQLVRVEAGKLARVDLALAPVPEGRARARRRKWTRIALDAVVTGGSAALGTVAVLRYTDATDAYETYQGLTYADDPDAFYEDEVRRPRTLAYVFGGTAAAGLVGSGVLWATTPWYTPTSGWGVEVSRPF